MSRTSLSRPLGRSAPTASRRRCPACSDRLESTPRGWSCTKCQKDFPDVAGLADLRLGSDRYLSLTDERAKAERLAAIAERTDLKGLAEAYYAITSDVDPARCRSFLAHILKGEARGEILAESLPESGEMLEIGCGTGGLLAAARRKRLEVSGTDIAARWLVVARRRLDDLGMDQSVELTAGSAECLPWSDGAFDIVAADSLIEHLDNPARALGECFRVLRPGGSLRLWSPNRFSVLPDPHVRLWGVSWLPRNWGRAYVRLRRGGPWLPMTRSAWEIERLARASGFQNIQVKAFFPGDRWASTLPVSLRTLARVGRRRAAVPGLSTLSKAFGPLWVLSATKRGER